MTLLIHSEEDAERQLSVTVEVPEDRVQSQMRRTARALSRQIRIPGFRRGKVPYNILVRRVGEEALRADAVEEMLESVLAEALEDIDAVPYRQPTLDDMEMKPLVLKMTIPLEPTVELGDYRAIRKDIEPVEVTDEALEEAVDRVRARHQVLEEVERPVEVGDMVTLKGEGKTSDDGEVIWHEHGAEMVMDPDISFPGVPFVENILGLSAGEDREFQFSFSDDYDEKELAGREASFEVTVEKVQSRFLPELDDELAQEEGDYETVDELRQALLDDLYEQASRQAKSDLLDEVIEDILAGAKIVYPPAAVESELDGTIESFKEQVTRSGMQWEDYLKLQSESEASLREQWRDQAIERVQRGLVLRQFIEEEKLTVESADIDLALEERLSRFGDNEELREQLRDVFASGQGLEMMSNDIMLDKVHERVEEIVSGNAPDLEALQIEEAEASEALMAAAEEEE